MKLKLPTRRPKQGQSSGQSSAGSKIQAPAFVNDVYRDMRDRRLLVPALALLLAIIAVPILLGSSAAPEPTAPPTAFDKDAQAVVPGVLAEGDAGVRDYRERLAALKQKNPFAEKFKAPEPAGSDGALADPVIPVSEPEPAPGTGSLDGGAPIGGSPSTGGGSSATPPGSSEPTLVILEARIDAYVGEVGKQKPRENIKPGARLPEPKTPVVMFLGATRDLKYADFVVSRDVTKTTGDGKCSGKGKTCEFLRLEDGQTQYFRWGADDKRYSIRVTDISSVVVDRRKGG